VAELLDRFDLSLNDRRRGAARDLEGLGAHIVPVSVPSVDEVTANWLAACAVEAAVAHEATFPAQADRYGPVLRGRLEKGSSLDGQTIAKVWMARLAFSGAFANLMRDIEPGIPELGAT
jgi:amidase